MRQQCEHVDPPDGNRKSKRRCKELASVFVTGVWRCHAHRPVGDAHCSHSLAPSGTCAFCGAVASCGTMDNEREET